MWFDAPIKYWLWAAGLVFGLLVTVLRGDSDTRRQLDRLTARFDNPDAKQRKRGSSKQDSDFHLVTVDIDTTHLDERLGVFVIIVLGEAVSQLVLAAATTGWTHAFVATVTIGFLILVGLWWITFSYGFAAAPHTRLASMPPRYGLPLHLLSTVGIVCLAAGLGELARAADESLPTSLRWVMCAGLSVHFLSSGIGGVADGASWKWLTFWSVPSVLVPIATGIWGGELPSLVIALTLFAPIAWQLLYARVVSVPASARR